MFNDELLIARCCGYGQDDAMDEMIFAALHVLLAYQGHSFEREEPRCFQQGFQVA